MTLLEESTHSFIIKLWLEATDEQSQKSVWRGHITHVPSRKRVYFDQYEAILAFIRPFIDQAAPPPDEAD